MVEVLGPSNRSFPSNVIFRSALKVRPIIKFYVEIITLVLVIALQFQSRNAFVRQLISSFERHAPCFTATHYFYSCIGALVTMSVCHCAVKKIGLGSVKIFSSILFLFV